MVLAACVGAASLIGFAIWRHVYGFSMVDMLVYRAEGAAVVHHQDLYAMRLPGWDLAATYPPFAAILFAPSSWLKAATLRIVVMLFNTALLALTVHLSVKLAGWPRKRFHLATVLLGTGLGVWLEPVWTTFQYGQINLAILCLVLWDMTRPDRAPTKGVGIGLATAIKITPGLFVVYLLLTKRVRAALVAAGTFLGAGLIGVVALPSASWGFWTNYLWDSKRVGVVELVDNQSVRGVVTRLMHTPGHPGTIAVVAAGLLGLFGVAVAVLAGRSTRILRRAEAWGTVATALTALLISPISWTHHWVWCVPLLVLLAAEARSWRTRTLFGVVLAVFLSYSMWLAPNQNGQGVPWSWQLPTSSYAPVAVAVLLHLGLKLRQARNRPTAEAADADLILQQAGLESIDPPMTRQG
ncbi:glycosyltransferase 87 family protein [Kitasatospora viridis]|uniref:glycosyltransferase 87 family protein n=1 Tax=Kitasatospora viridis TaxID=281105 RepID=UPI0011A677A7|nr:glycosyltransferase 87 family protein [Kitasatospora viridis]